MAHGCILGGLNFDMQMLLYQNKFGELIAFCVAFPNSAQLLLKSGHEQIDFRTYSAIAGLWYA